MTWLVTGGAGYIGGHVVRRLREHGLCPVILDDLSTGRIERVPEGVPLVIGSVTNRDTVERVLRDYAVTGVLHLAARKSPAESVARPDFYHRENVGGVAALLFAMGRVGVQRLVFSSTAAVYGIPSRPLVTEREATLPINPYGQTKLLGERLIQSTAAGCGLSWVALRYFNVAGAAEPHLADLAPTNLVPIVLDAVSAGRTVTVTGADYPTRDGTGVRDYIHVCDLAQAHLMAALHLSCGPTREAVYNVGNGRGYSVLEVLDRVGEVTGRPVSYVLGPRRPGDPPEVVADASRIRTELGWSARYDLTEMIATTWLAWSAPVVTA